MTRKIVLSALLIALSPALPARTAPPAAAPVPKSVVRFEMQLTRADRDEKTPTPAPPPLLLAAPIVSTLDGQTATIAVNAPQTSSDLSYNIALSPTLGKADNTVEVLWSLRLSGKTLPGAASVSLSGAVRVVLGKEAAIGEITLADPQTGKQSVFRLTSKTTREDRPQTPQTKTIIKP